MINKKTFVAGVVFSALCFLVVYASKANASNVAECNGIYRGIVRGDLVVTNPWDYPFTEYSATLTSFCDATLGCHGYVEFIANGTLHHVQNPNTVNVQFGQPPQCFFYIEYNADPIFQDSGT